MTSPFFGFVFNNNTTDPTPPVLSDFAIGFLVLPSDDANATTFPLNKAVAINSGDTTVLAALGTGPLYKAVMRINAQLADLEVSALLVIVRVPTAWNSDGTENVAGTIANIVGDPAASTGLSALLKAAQLTNYTPRIGGAPGYTGFTSYAVTAPVITNQGHNYTHPVVAFTPPGAAATATVGNVGVQATAHAVLSGSTLGNIVVDNGGQDYPAAPSVTIAGGGGAGATAHAVLNGNGGVDHVAIDNAGTGFTSAPTVTLGAPAPGEITGLTLTNPGNYPPGTAVTMAIADSNGGTGAGATATISLELLANPICAALPAVMSRLLAHAIVGGPGGSKQDALSWRGTLNSPRLIPQDDWEIVADGTGTAFIDGAARSIGLAIRTDFLNGGYPFNAWANYPVQGALGLKRVDDFSLVDGATDGQELLAAGIGITVRGDLSDTSLDDSGYIAVSLNNATSDPLGNLYNKTRGRDFTNVALIKSVRKRLGKENITPIDVDAVLNDMAAINILLMSKNKLLGFKVGFNAADNTVEGLRAGAFTVYDNTEEPAPIILVTVNRGLDRAAAVNELEQLANATATITN